VTIRRFYDRWPQYHERMLDVVTTLTDEQLALRAAPDQWPIWAILSHLSGTRLYWLCNVLGEPGAEGTPWPDLPEDGWEDDLDHPRSAQEVAFALESTYAVIDRVLDEWSPEMLDERFDRTIWDTHQRHSRASILQRLLTHDAYHVGEVSQLLGANGIEPIYIWRADDPLLS
jgi:uncharacterized damage-inducible protein DinB